MAKADGIALIIVNLEFGNKKFNRKHVFGDKTNAESIWRDMFKFHVQTALNVKKGDFQDKLKKVKDDCIKGGYKNMAIVISSHGVEKMDDQGTWCHHIRFYDGLLPTKEGVINPISCTELRDVNKFVIIEACRTRSNFKNTKVHASETDAQAIGGNVMSGEDKGTLVYVTEDKMMDARDRKSKQNTDRQESIDGTDGDSDGDAQELSEESHNEMEPRAEMLRLPRSVIMFGAASGKIAYREDQKSSWLIQEWYNEVQLRRSKLMQAKCNGAKLIESKQLLDKERNRYPNDKSEELVKEFIHLEDQLRENDKAKEELENVSFIDLAVNVSGRISKRESKNENKAVGCIIYSVLEDTKLRLYCRDPPSSHVASLT